MSGECKGQQEPGAGTKGTVQRGVGAEWWELMPGC